MEANSLSIQFRDFTRFWVQFVLVPVVVIVGVLGNAITIFILTRRQMRVSSNIYLTALAISDLIFLISSFSLSWKHYNFMKSVQIYWSYFPFGLWITDASSSTSVWLTVSYTIERYIAVCHPMTGKASGTEKRGMLVSFFVYLLCFLFTASTPFEWKSVGVEDNTESRGMVFSLENTELGLNAWYRFVYHWFSTIVFVIVPVLILTIGNCFLIRAVRQSRRVLEGLASCHFHQRQCHMMRREDKITLTLIVIIIVFLICQLPTAAVLIYTSMHTPTRGGQEENILLGLGNIFNLLMAVNAACNFVLYTVLSDKYRRVFLSVFCFNSKVHRWYEKKYPRSVYTLPRVFPRRDAVHMSRVPQFPENILLETIRAGGNCAPCENNLAENYNNRYNASLLTPTTPESSNSEHNQWCSWHEYGSPQPLRKAFQSI